MFEDVLYEDHAAPLVAAGARWLDETMLGWFDRINLEVLDLNNAGACVLGQLADSIEGGADFYTVVDGPHRFTDGCRLPSLAALRLSQDEAEAFGFDYQGHTCDWPDEVNIFEILSELWTAEIRSRKNAQVDA